MVSHQSAMASIYQILLWLALPLVWVRLQLRARSEPAYALRQAERFGRVPEHVQPGCIWFHTVSAGETIAAAPLIRQLAEEYADTPVLVTTMTPTGSEQVITRLDAYVDHCYAPYDFNFAVGRFFARVKPRILVLMETELWPNLIHAAYQAGIPILLVNARLSERSARGYQRVIGLTRPMLEQITEIACQTEDHVARFVELGADPQHTHALGSVKFDVTLPADFAGEVAALRKNFVLADRQVWIAASTHPGEDELVLAAFVQVRKHHPQLCLLLVPRHPARSDSVCELVAKAGFNYCRQSERVGTGVHGDQHPTDVVIGDVMGTLLTLYGLADVAFVGGSLVEQGGHNPLEPALCHLPLVCGPHQFNFSQVMDTLQQRGGLVTVHTSDELAQVIRGWLEDAAQRQAVGEAAAATLDENRGATERVAALVRGKINSTLGR